MSRLESGSLKLDVHPARLASLLETAVDAIRPASRAKEIALEIDSSGALQEIACDEQRVRQILWNFLSNAVKFTPRGGRISVMAITGDRKLLVTVADTGAGITPEFLPYVFDCFRQQDTATTRSHGGLGIGLAIAKHLAELHGGKVQAASDGVGHGSTFTLTLPLGPIRPIATS
jgi:signal transduction histidine kinase